MLDISIQHWPGMEPCRRYFISANIFFSIYPSKFDMYVKSVESDMTFRLRHIEVFHAIMSAGSVSKAAERLRTSQPTASRLLAELERSVGFALFIRDKRSISPTPEARDLYREVRRNFTCLDQLTDIAERIAAHEYGSLRITSAPSISISILPRAIQRFLDRYPGVGTTLEVRTPQSVIESVESRDFDIGITAPTSTSDLLVVQPLVQVEAVCVLPEDHPLAAKETIHASDLTDQAYISLGRNSMSRQRTDAVFDQVGVHRDMVAETQTGSVACALVSQGIGLAILDFLTVEVVAKPPLIYRPFRPRIGIDFVLISAKMRPNARMTDRFLTVFDETLADIESPFVTNLRA